MRSETGQDCLFDVPAPDRSGVRRRRPAQEPPTAYLLGGELTATRGWPAGTEVVLDRQRRPARGDVVVVREGGETRAGVFQVRFGRSVLVSDRGAGWIGPATEVLGVATLVGAALEGMPD